MKQPEDNKTMDMYGGEVKESEGAKLYMFYVETTDGTAIEWRGLTLAQAKNMHSYTRKRSPGNVARYGWEETKGDGK